MKRMQNMLLGLTVICTSAFAQEKPKLSFGVGAEVSVYPAVQWIQGEPVTKFDKDKIYIIECWATWCAPCIAAIPHMNELHKKIGDRIVFIGQNIIEDDPKKVAAFVKEKGDEMNYRIAYGGGVGSDFHLKFMKAAGTSGIPQTFVIQNNKVVWITSEPSELTEKLLQLLIDHKFSIEAVEEKPDPVKLITKLIYEKKEYDKAMVLLDSCLKKDPFNLFFVNMKSILYRLMGKPADATSYFKQVAHDERSTSLIKFSYFQRLRDDKQWDILAEELEAFFKQNPKDASLIAESAEVMLSLVHYKKGNLKEATVLLDKLLLNSKNPTTLMMISEFDKFATDLKPDDPITAIMNQAGEKSLKLNPINLSLAQSLVGRYWKSKDKNKAQWLAEKTLSDLRKLERQEIMVSIFKKLLISLKNDILPSDEQFKIWSDELRI